MTGRTPAHTRSLVVVQHGAVGPPIYCFHALGGSVAPYGDLAHRLNPAQQVFGLQAAGLNGQTVVDHTVLDMASRYANEIAEDGPRGPSVFLGYSLGGVLAVEAARLLANLLPVPPVIVAIDSDPAYVAEGGGDGWWILVRQVLGLDLPVAGLAAQSRTEALAAVRVAAATQRKLPPRFGLDRLGHLLDVCHANEHAAAQYRPLHFSGTVHSVRSGEPGGPDAWERFVDRVVVHRVTGNHFSIMSPQGTPQLAERIRQILISTVDR